MSGIELLEAMSYVDERFVDEAEKQTIRKGSGASWMKWASLAACICILIAGAIPFLRGVESGPMEGIASEGATDIRAESAMEDFSGMESAQEAPEGSAESVDTVILRVLTATESGFTATVEKAADSDRFETGRELTVVLTESAESAAQDNMKTCREGALVEVRLVSFDEATNTIVAELLLVIEE